MVKSSLWLNKDFVKIYNKLVQDKKRHPEKYTYTKSMKSLALSEYNLLLQAKEESISKSVDEQERIKQELKEERKRQSPLEFGIEPALREGEYPTVSIIEGIPFIDYSKPCKKKQSDIWNI